MSNTTSPDRKCPKCGTPLAANTTEGLCPACLLALNLMTQTQLTGEAAGPHGTKKVQSPPEAPPSPDEIAQFFPQFEILECLGRGGMGVVYKARQKSLDRLVALKILSPEREKDSQFEERFIREAKTLAQLNHPSIVTVHDFGEANGMFYLVMEFVDGANLRHLLTERKLSPEEALAIVPPVCEALQFAHGQGVVHRDIKPENLLLDKQGRIKIADFGIAKILGRAGSPLPAATESGVSTGVPEATQVIGTPQYMAPEQTSTPKKVDHRADIYSLGVVLYEMLTGELPALKLQAPSKKVQVDVRIDEIVLRALEQEPDRRYQTAEQFKTMVETIAETPDIRSRGRESAPTDSERADERTRRLASAATSGDPRFSRTAIVGACGVPFVAFSILLPVVFGVDISLSVLPGLAIAITTTILGLIAVSQIRRSAGKLRGLGLAIFDGLVFPLLVLITVLWFVWYSLLDWAFPVLQGLGIQQPSLTFSLLVWLPWFAGSVALCVWAVRQARRAINRTAKNAAQTLAPQRLLWRFAAGAGVVLLSITVFVVWAQRPRLWDNKTISADSPDQMYSAMGQTWHAMRVFGGDRSFYRFTVQGRGGAVFYRWEVPVPTEKLATNYVLLSMDEISFRRHGSILWSDDSKRVSFRVNGIEVSGFDTDTGKETYNYNLRRRVDVAALSLAGSVRADHPVVEVVQGGSAEVQLAGGISVEVIGVLRNPRNSNVWLKPDGSVFDTAPAEVVQLAEARAIGSPAPAIVPENEVLVYYRIRTPQSITIRQRGMRWQPQPWHLQTGRGASPTVRDTSGELRYSVDHFALREAVPALDLTVELVASDAEWEPVAEFNGERTKELGHGMVLFSPPRFDEDANRHVIDVMHNLSRKDHTLRLTAHLKGGRRKDIDFHPGVLSGTPTKGYALVYPSEVKVDEVEKWVLGRTPRLRGEIKNIAVQPRANTVGDAEAITATFGPVIERDLVGSESLTNCFLDADTGRVFSAPKELLESLRTQGQLGPSLPQVMFISDWARTNGVDFVLRSGESRLLLLQGLTIESAHGLEAHAASEVLRFPGEDLVVLPGSQMSCDFDPADAEARTWVFRTREGGCGVLQITGDTDRPNAAKVRYKLVQEAGVSPNPGVPDREELRRL